MEKLEKLERKAVNSLLEQDSDDYHSSQQRWAQQTPLKPIWYPPKKFFNPVRRLKFSSLESISPQPKLQQEEQSKEIFHSAQLPDPIPMKKQKQQSWKSGRIRFSSLIMDQSKLLKPEILIQEHKPKPVKLSEICKDIMIIRESYLLLPRIKRRI
ncbi:hypothetical protein pb186bvf_004091 [Paramecium bursaria]